MKFKVRVTISDTTELDTDNYEADTVEGCMAEQLAAWSEGASDPADFIGLGGEFESIEYVGD